MIDRNLLDLFLRALPFCAAVTLPLAVYSADPDCHWNVTVIDCDKADTSCPMCNLPTGDCTQYTRKIYTGDSGIYTVTQVPDGTGAYKETGTSQKKSCYAQYSCTQSTVEQQGCTGSGCSVGDGEQYKNTFCRQCGTSDLADVGAGQYTVYDLSATGCGSS